MAQTKFFKGTNTGKLCIPSEIAYAIAIITLAFAVAILTAADFGISMIVAPAYLLSMKLGTITFGQAEYVIQAGIFVLLCFILKRFKPVYLMSFITCLIYGAVLDLWRMIPLFNTAVTNPDTMPIWLRIFMFIIGVVLTSFSVSLFFKTYLYPQVYDFFVKAVSVRYGIKLSCLKTCVDILLLIISTIMTFCFFGKLEGVNWGTVVMATVNGSLIEFFSKKLDYIFTFRPCFFKFASHFEFN